MEKCETFIFKELHQPKTIKIDKFRVVVEYSLELEKPPSNLGRVSQRG